MKAKLLFCSNCEEVTLQLPLGSSHTIFKCLCQVIHFREIMFHPSFVYNGILGSYNNDDSGTVRVNENLCYEGQWKNAKFNGHGKLSYKTRYQILHEGTWIEGKPDGKGMFTYYDSRFKKDRFIYGVWNEGVMKEFTNR